MTSLKKRRNPLLRRMCPRKRFRWLSSLTDMMEEYPFSSQYVTAGMTLFHLRPGHRDHVLSLVLLKGWWADNYFFQSMEQFQDFEKYMNAVNPYGMKSGIVLIDPPEEW
jgi:jmjN domain